MKKNIAIMLTLILALSLLTACGGGNSNTPSNSSSPPIGGVPGVDNGDNEDGEEDNIWPDEYKVTIDIIDMTFEGEFFKEGDGPDGKPVYRIRFEDAKAEPKTFNLFGFEYTETWTLNMTSGRIHSDSPYKIDGAYEGTYTIDIEYNMSEFPGRFKHFGLEGSKWVETSDWFYDAPASLAVTPGTNTVRRTIKGTVKTFLWRDPVDGACSITPWEESNEKDVYITFSTELVGVKNVPGGSITTWAYYDFMADETTMNALLTGNHTEMVAMGHKQDIDDVDVGASMTVIWYDAGDIWRRGDEADSFWKITLTP